MEANAGSKAVQANRNDQQNRIDHRNQVRRFYKNRRDAMSGHLVIRLSDQISRNILQWDIYQDAETVLFYYPLGKEVSLLPVINDALLHGKHTAFPKVDGTSMRFYEITSLDELAEGCFHIMEPPADHARQIDPEAKLCFVPGTAFDRAGGRMGYGRGYYDHCFADSSTILAACAYECQIAGRIPMAAWDKNMDYLISEHGIQKTAWHRH